MKLKDNTVLVIGGSAGIGREIAREFHNNGDKVIITGRNKNRLDDVVHSFPGLSAITHDITNGESTHLLIAEIEREFPNVNIVINCAATGSLYSVVNEGDHVYEKISEETYTNYLSIARLIEKILPLLKRQKEAAIVNVSSIVAIVPSSLVGYSASKAALHSYTQSLRFELSKQFPSIKVFELMPPLVNTEFSKSIGGEHGIPASKVAEDLFEAMGKDIYEIRVGFTDELYKMFLASPEKAFMVFRASREKKPEA